MQTRSHGSTPRLRVPLAACVAILLLSPNTSTAQAEAEKVTPLLKGQSAPFTGQLLPVETAIRLGVKASQCNERTAAEVSRAVRLVGVDLDLSERKRAIEAEAAASRLELMRMEVDEAQRWYRAPVFVAGVSVLLTAALVVLARETVIEVQR